MQRLSRVVVLALAVVLAASVLTAEPAAARTDDRAKPVIFIHGLDAWDDAGSDCAMWHPMMNALRSWGHTGTFHTIKYYTYDTNCTNAIYSGDQNVSIVTLGNKLAWWIWNSYTSRGIAVDIVGHSMGGLIARSALAQAGGAGAPSYLYVEDIVTYGTPHAGSGWAYGCGWLHCEQIRPGSTFLTNLPQNPQGAGGTDWSLVSSDSDAIVSAESGHGMYANHEAEYRWPDYGHSDYFYDVSTVSDADVYYNDGYGWNWWTAAPRGARWGDYALMSRDW